MKRITTVIFTVALMLATVPGAAYALNAEALSLTVVMKADDELLRGISVAVCRVADAKTDKGSVVYTAVPAFAGAGADFTNLTKARNIALAANLDAYAAANNIPRGVKVTGSDGKAAYADLSPGLFLVAQVDSENSEYIIAPYLVAVPGAHPTLRGAMEYNVVALPKTEPVKRDAETTSVRVFKMWKGADSHPASVQVQLLKNGQAHAAAVTLNAGNHWSHTWNGLSPADTWTVDEFDVPAGYTKDISGSAKTGYIITNTKKSDAPAASVSVQKVWAGGQTGGAILVQLYRGGVPFGNCVALDAGNQWSHTWEGLDPDGPWTVDEFDVDFGYIKSIVGSATGGFVITNTRAPGAPEKILLSGGKEWVHGNNPTEKQPKYIELHINANGKFILQKRITAADHWNWNILMDKYDKDGKEIVYTVDESPVAGYGKTVKGFDITNTYSAGGAGPGGPGGPGSTPKTDDTSNLTLWLGLMASSTVGLAALMIILVWRKRREREKIMGRRAY